MNPKVGLVTFYFHPFGGVGAHRWSKISKYLVRQGYHLHVFTADWTFSGSLLPQTATPFPGLTVHRIPASKCLHLRHKTLSPRVLDDIKNFYFGRFHDRLGGNSDEGALWAQHARPFIRKVLLEEGIRILIATGGPFSINHLAAQLKREIPSLSLIQDFRDTWHPASSTSEKEYSSAYLEAIEQADRLVVVTDLLAKDFRHGHKKSIEIIRNGFDAEDFRARPPRGEQPPLKVIHLGNLTNGRNKTLYPLLDLLLKRPELQNGIRLTVAGTIGTSGYWPMRWRYRRLFKKGIVRLLSRLPQSEALQLLLDSDRALVIAAEGQRAYLPVKLFEYAASGIPILSLDRGGETHDFIMQNRLGISVDPLAQNLEEALIPFFRPVLHFDPKPIPDATYEVSASRFAEIIQDLAQQHTFDDRPRGKCP